jgi:hypothetical protein
VPLPHCHVYDMFWKCAHATQALTKVLKNDFQEYFWKISKHQQSVLLHNSLVVYVEACPTNIFTVHDERLLPYQS